MRILLVKTRSELKGVRALEGFICLEPLELEIIAGVVEPEDSVRILDLRLQKNPRQAFLDALRADQPDLIGFTGYSIHVQAIKDLARLAKVQRPEASVMVGGIHASLLPHDFMAPEIDLIIRGEGSTALRELLRRLKAGQPPEFPPACLSTRHPDCAIHADMPLAAYPPIEQAAAPRRDLVDRSRYFFAWTAAARGARIPTLFPRVASVRTSIGCAQRCSFCISPTLTSGRYITVPAEQVVDEIATVPETYIAFTDDEMFLDTKRARQIAELILSRGIRKHYYSWARSDTIIRHPELFKLWKQAGLDTLFVGLESVDNTRLAAYNKSNKTQNNMEAVQVLRDLEINLHAAYIVDPDFTEADFDLMEKEILSVSPAEIAFTVLTPTPGSALWQQSDKQFLIDPYLYSDCFHTLKAPRLSLKRFYLRYGRLTALALRNNPLRINKVRVPAGDFAKAFIRGIRYIIAHHTLHRDYPAGVRH
jgi:radical SAM superfamily enzyme YgiQ (UPF0313 family)